MMRLFYIIIFIIFSAHCSIAQIAIFNDEAYITPDEDMSYDDNNYKFQILKKVEKKDLKIPECGERSINLVVCEPSVCKVSSVMGDVYYKVGVKNDFCYYQERSPKMTGMDCHFEMKMLPEINDLFSKRILNIAGLKQDISKEDVDRLEYIYQHHCTIVPNVNYTKVVTLDDKENGLSDIPSEIIDTANISDLLRYDPTSSFVKSAESKGGLASNLEEYRSIMFTGSEIDLIYVLQEIIKSNRSQGQAFDASSIFNTGALGMFYLNSLLYKNEDHWVVWMNNIKMTDMNQSKSLKIEKVMQDKVRFKWLSTNLDRVSPNWKNRMVGIDPEKYISRDFDISISIKGDKAEVTFGLKPNQTFDATTMYISEGKK